jgi:hypothetical protein
VNALPSPFRLALPPAERVGAWGREGSVEHREFNAL